MKARKDGPSRWLSIGLWAWCGLVPLVGCALGRPCLDQQIQADHQFVTPNSDALSQYHVTFPDVLALAISTRPELGGRTVVGPDGCIDLGTYGRLRVEGASLGEIQRGVAACMRVRPDWVQVEVADFKGQQIYLFGEGAGVQRTVAYQGPETVLELLRRTGGVTPGAAPGAVYVVRPHLVEGRQPEVFHIDLQQIVGHQDQRTNLRLQPFDQVHVGETRQSSLVKCFPRWFQPLYESLCGLNRRSGGLAELNRSTSVVGAGEQAKARVRASAD